MAAAIARQRSDQLYLDWDIDSAGTGAWHIGKDADPRTQAECRRRGTPLVHVARQVAVDDFTAFDHILAMDQRNLADLEALRPRDGVWPQVIGAFDRAAPGSAVVDPYHDGPEAFVACYDQLARCIDGLIRELSRSRS